MAEKSVPKFSGRFKNLTGEKFNRLTVLEFSYVKTHSYWKCQCDCGKIVVVAATNLKRGLENKKQGTKSCGCLIKEKMKKHGGRSFPEYDILRAIYQRCFNEKCDHYKYYGERGITVCDRWRYGENGKNPFTCFIEDMGRRPSSKHSIDRINNDGNYEPSNCRWATITQQALNKRKRNQK